MNSRARAVVSLAILGIVTPVFACPGVVPCVPSACLEMHRQLVRNPQSSAPGTDFSSMNVSLLSNLPLSQIGGGTDGSSLYAWVDPQTQREYAIMGRSNGTAVVDVTNPTQPVYVANIPSIGGVSTIWREPKVYGNYAYIGVDGSSHRMQIVDLTQVRNYSGSTMTLSYGSYSSSVTRIHTLAVNKDSGFLYLSGTNLNSGAPHIVDVRNPASPVAAGNIPGGVGWDGYSHESQVVTYNGPDAQYQGREIMFSSNGKQGTAVDTLSIVDVTNKTSPTRISTKTYTNARYIHQGWLTEDQRYFFQNDELDEPNFTGGHTRTHLWDLADLDNPVYRGFWDNNTTSIDHNLYVKGNYVYQTNYTTGLRILKIGNLASTNPADWLEEIAWFDTFPASDAASFNGAWNNYPFLPSGNILVSDIDGGLFVLRANLPSEPVGDLFHPKQFAPIFNPVPEPGATAVLIGSIMLFGLRRRR